MFYQYRLVNLKTGKQVWPHVREMTPGQVRRSNRLGTEVKWIRADKQFKPKKEAKDVRETPETARI